MDQLARLMERVSATGLLAEEKKPLAGNLVEERKGKMMIEKTTSEVVHMKYPSMTWSRGYIHAGGDFFACRLITAADDPRGVGPAISTTLGAGITTYDGCSIEQTPPTMHDESFVVLGGNLRLLTGEDYNRVIEAKFGDVLWLPRGAFWKFQGEKASIFYVVYPVVSHLRSPAVITGTSKPEAIHLKSQDMVFSQVQSDAGGYASSCELVTTVLSKTIGIEVRTYDRCSIERTTTYDEAIVVLDGTLRILTGDNYSRSIEAKFSDVVWVPKGTRLRYQGDKAKMYSARYPIERADQKELR